MTSNIFYCTAEAHCPKNYSLLVPNSKECIKANEIESTDKSDLFDIDNDRKINQSIYDIIQDMLNEFNLTDINNGNDKTIILKNLIMILTSTQNQKNNEDINNLTMNLGECENILKDNYTIKFILIFLMKSKKFFLQRI